MSFLKGIQIRVYEILIKIMKIIIQIVYGLCFESICDVHHIFNFIVINCDSDERTSIVIKENSATHSILFIFYTCLHISLDVTYIRLCTLPYLLYQE